MTSISTKKVLCVVGTRPEAIKMAPVIAALRTSGWAQVRVLATAQHRELLDGVLALFGICPDIDLNIMQPNQDLVTLTARLLPALNEVLVSEDPDVLLAQGDTTTVMTAALACFYRGVPFGHVEAGLRTGDLRSPFPEEMNRVVAGRLARWHFAPTASASRNLLAEALPPESIAITGNTVIDALLEVAAGCDDSMVSVPEGKRLVLVTAHRRENFGARFLEICRALRELAEQRTDIFILYPVHPNPNIREVAQRTLAGLANLSLVDPLDYRQFVAAMRCAHIILSDSGGIQEEAPALGKPVLVLRTETERPEAVEAGVVKLVGPSRERILEETLRLLDDMDYYRSMARGVSPYGDGHAAERICAILRRDLLG